MAALGMLFWWSVSMEEAARACSNAYQGSLATSQIQETTVGSDHRRYCSMTYDTLSSWDDCIGSIHTTVPIQVIASKIQPIVLNVLALMGDQSASLNALKLEHDDQCKDQIDTMFYPPTPEK